MDKKCLVNSGTVAQAGEIDLGGIENELDRCNEIAYYKE